MRRGDEEDVLWWSTEVMVNEQSHVAIFEIEIRETLFGDNTSTKHPIQGILELLVGILTRNDDKAGGNHNTEGHNNGGNWLKIPR